MRSSLLSQSGVRKEAKWAGWVGVRRKARVKLGLWMGWVSRWGAGRAVLFDVGVWVRGEVG